jgi:hypothetical protein
MEAPPDVFGVLACLTLEENQSEAALVESARLARELNAPLKVVQLYPEAWRGPLKPHTSAWHLRSDDPVEALRRFAARNRITHIVC